MLDVGAQAPHFALANQDGKLILLDRLLEDCRHLVVYFFLQSDSPGCTREACGFREVSPDLQARRIRVVGISTDPVSVLGGFSRANHLDFDLLSDPDHEVCEAWGAWRGEGVRRMTFLLDPRGTITHVFPRVNVYQHAADLVALFPAIPLEQGVEGTGPGNGVAALDDPTLASRAAVGRAITPVGGVVVSAPSTSELVITLARTSLQLLLAQLEVGVSLPPDIAELAARIAARRS